jgi:putative membrane-bound dehydrogenase-like protein
MEHPSRAGLVIQAILICLTAFVSQSAYAQEDGSAPLPPGEALRSFELHAEFRVELVASEPLVQDPVAMAFDEDGVLYVIEYPEFNEYQFPRGVSRKSRVKRLIDEDGDGQFDSATVFVEAPFATAVICYDGGVFVGAPPDVLFCRDTDQDGVADEKRVVLTGFGRDFAGGGLLNSFRWGLDQRIHMATGFAGGKVIRLGNTDSKPVDVRSRGLILNPRTLEIEATSGGGQHGLGIDDWGNKYLCSNVYPLQHLIYDDRYVARNPFFAPPAATRNINGEDPLATLKRISPLEPWRVARSRSVAQERPEGEGSRAGGVFTSASGITVYRGDAFPDDFYGNVFVGEVANNLVYRARIESRGIERIALRADRKAAEFLASKDPWFRPVQFANGPDGALYVVDMYRELIEGAAFVPRESLAKIDPSRGTSLGRIYRVVPRSFERRSPPRLSKSTTPELIQLLQHGNAWHRETAARLLVQRDDPTAIGLLQQLARTSKIPQARVVALITLASLRALQPALLVHSLEDESPRVREQAVRLAESQKDASPELENALFGRVSDPDIHVRYQLAFSLGAFQGSQRNASLATLIRAESANQWLMTAVQSSLSSGGGEVFARMVEDPQTFRQESVKRFLLDLATQIGRQSSRQSNRSELTEVLKSLATLEDSHEEFVITVLQKLLVRGQLAELSDVSGIEAAQATFRKSLQFAKQRCRDESQPVELRVQSVRILGLASLADQELSLIFGQLLDPDQLEPIQSAACDTLARFKSPQVADVLLSRWSRMTPLVRGRAIETLLSRSIWTSQVFDAIEGKTVFRNDIDSARIRLLELQSDETTRSRIQRLFPTDRGVARQSVIVAYQSSLKLKGDMDRGREVFKRTCAVCHKRKQLGKSAGPHLNDTARRPAEVLLVDILDPGREMKSLYQNYVVHMSDGRVLTGMILDETPNGIRLQQADGKLREVLRIDIERLQSTGISFMPEGLEKSIDLQAMADLLRFLGH